MLKQKKFKDYSIKPWQSSPWITLPLPLLTAILAIFLWLLLPSEDVMHILREGGPIEGLTEKMYFLLAVSLWLSPRQAGELRVTLALTILLLAAGAREMDLHKAFTGYSVLKVSFYLQDRPLLPKLIAFFFIFLIAVAALYLLRMHGLSLWKRFHQHEPVASGLFIFFVTMIITKILDRSINLLAEDFNIYSSEGTLVLVSALEETVEMSLPMIAAVVRWQFIKLRPKNYLC